jgi:hypothetical protein
MRKRSGGKAYGYNNTYRGAGMVELLAGKRAKEAEEMKRYTFHVYLGGEGNTPEEAWQDAVEGFALDPGNPDYDLPSTWTEEEMEEVRV